MLSNKKKGLKKPPKNASSSLAGSAKQDSEPQKINVLDSAAVKRELDEASIRAAKSAGYKEDHFVSNVKIMLGLLTCLIALVAQFWPQKHPNNWWLLFCCIVAYAACTAALNLFLLRFEGEAFFFTVARKEHPALKFVSKMPRYSDKYTLLISKSNETNQFSSILQLWPWIAALKSLFASWQNRKQDSSDQAEMTHPVTKYFHSDGYVNESVFGQDVQQLLQHSALSGKSKPL